MSLGFDFSLTGAARRRASPWWHGYRAGPGGPLPDVVIEDEGARIHGASLLEAGALDLSGLNLDGGFTLYARGQMSYTLGASGFPRFAEVGTAGNTANRQVVFIYELDGRLRAAGLAAGASQYNAILSAGAQPDQVEFRLAVRFAPNDFTATLNGGAFVADSVGAVPTGLDRLFLRRTETTGQAPGHVARAVIWTDPLTPAQMQSYAA